MGWNSWNTYGCEITQDTIKAAADQVVALGLDKLGYNYINVDDCWNLVDRDASGHIQYDSAAFPDGMTALGDYIHSKNLLYGLYSSAGTLTCEGRAASLGHELTDARDFSIWGVDYLKYDNCNNEGQAATERYTAMRDALVSTGVPIFYSICNWGEEHTWQWAPATGNSWRTTPDIFNNWLSVRANFLLNLKHFERSGPGGWNDPDMLEVGVHDGNGNYGLTVDEEKTHFALWAVSKAPLIIGANLDSIRDESLEIYKASELIEVNQDKVAKQATCFMGCNQLKDDVSVYVTTVSDGSPVATIVNWANKESDPFTLNLKNLGVIPFAY